MDPFNGIFGSDRGAERGTLDVLEEADGWAHFLPLKQSPSKEYEEARAMPPQRYKVVSIIKASDGQYVECLDGRMLSDSYTQANPRSVHPLRRVKRLTEYSKAEREIYTRGLLRHVTRVESPRGSSFLVCKDAGEIWIGWPTVEAGNDERRWYEIPEKYQGIFNKQNDSVGINTALGEISLLLGIELISVWNDTASAFNISEGDCKFYSLFDNAVLELPPRFYEIFCRNDCYMNLIDPECLTNGSFAYTPDELTRIIGHNYVEANK